MPASRRLWKKAALLLGPEPFRPPSLRASENAWTSEAAPGIPTSPLPDGHRAATERMAHPGAKTTTALSIAAHTLTRHCTSHTSPSPPFGRRLGPSKWLSCEDFTRCPITTVQLCSDSASAFCQLPDKGWSSHRMQSAS